MSAGEASQPEGESGRPDLAGSTRGGGEARRAADVVLVTNLFPPAVGGTPALFETLYGQLRGRHVTVLTHGSVRGHERRGEMWIVRRPLESPHWGILHPRGLFHYVSVARTIRQLAPARSIVHCGRVIPEGLDALFARLAGGSRYLCWTHGEEFAVYETSREIDFLARCVERRASAILANSRNTASILMARGIPAGRIHVVYPGIDPGRFHPAIDGSRVRRRFVREGELLLLTVGRLQRRKGHDLVIQALARARRELPPLRYVIAGEGAERERLGRLSAEAGVADLVVFAGEVPAEDLPETYAACDIFVHPNRVEGRDIEGFGIVFLEAQASGKPVIGGKSGGVPEAVADGETGILVEGDDPVELAAAILRLAKSEELRKRLGAAGRARVLAGFTREQAAARLESVHDGLASGRGSAASCRFGHSSRGDGATRAP